MAGRLRLFFCATFKTQEGNTMKHAGIKKGYLLTSMICLSFGSNADVFGSGSNQFAIDFVEIGNPGNAADSTGYGAVDYSYRIGKYEITRDQFYLATTFDSSIGYQGNASSSGLSPTSGISWYEAIRYCNWLTSGDADSGAYQFNQAGNFAGVIDRDAAIATYGTAYVMPTEDEWYKAAYYTGTPSDYWSLYAYGDDNVPPKSDANYYDGAAHIRTVDYGLEEQNGTYCMMGNIEEWTETAADGPGRVISRGGNYAADAPFMSSEVRSGYGLSKSFESDGVGFRIVAVIPEPASVALLALGGIIAAGYRQIRKTYGI
jgi:hypothetical protein